MEFTEREREILAAMRDGNTSYREISERLGITESTVHSHLNNMYKKTGIRDKTKLSITAILRGWLSSNGG